MSFPDFRIFLLRNLRSGLTSFFKDGLSSSKTSNRDPEWRAGHVVESGAVEELDRVRIAAVLTADADF